MEDEGPWHQGDERSPLAEALAAVGDRWTLLVVEALLDGPARFNDLQDGIAGIAPNILSERLRRLEREGLAVAQPYSERPPRYVYELTTSGTELAGALRLLADWGARHSGRSRSATTSAERRSRRAGTAQRAIRASRTRPKRACTSPEDGAGAA